MSRPLLDRVDEWKRRFEPGKDGRLERLLGEVSRRRFHEPADLMRLHETLLFLRAYPRSPAVARLSDEILAGFAERIRTAGLSENDAFEDPEISGIAGTSLCAIFTYEFARALATRYPTTIEIAWDRYDEIDRLGPVLARVIPMFAEDWPVEAHAPFREWIAAARPAGGSDLAWLLDRLAALELPHRECADLYASLQLPLLWTFPDPCAARSGARLAARRKLYCHNEPLLRRADISLSRELEEAPLPVRRLSAAAAGRVLSLIHDTSAMRYRELYGFSHPDESSVWHADAGRGTEIVFFGVPPEWRLPLRAYHSGMFFKNGVPAGYVEVLSLFERAEVGFNLYYTFREGESAWLYARLLRLFRQVLGVTCYSVDPYQIGHENPEAIDSGAFWFYRKMGFRPTEPQIAALTAREEDRMRRTPGHRSSKRMLEKLAAGYIIYEHESAEAGAWDRFRIRTVGMACQRPGARGEGLERVLGLIPDFSEWSAEESAAADDVIRAKRTEEESVYLQLMRRHTRLRAAVLALGSPSRNITKSGSAILTDVGS